MCRYTSIMEGSFGSEVFQGDHFEQQFSKKEVVQTTGGHTEVIDIEPLNSADGVPVLFAPGWGATLQTNKESLKIIHDANRRIVSVSHPRREESVAKDSDFPVAETRRVQSILAVMGQKRLEKVDVIAHSQGAIDTIIAATLYPDKFRNIVLVSPGGLIGEDKLHKLVGKMLVSSVHDITQAMRNSHEIGPLTNAAKELAKYFAKNPKRAIEELNAIAKSDILEMVKNLHQYGIGISVITGVDDPSFPINRMIAILRNSENTIDGFYSVKGGHNKIVTDERYTRAALNALDSLKYKHQRSFPTQ